MNRLLIRELIIDDHEIDLDDITVGDLILKLQEIVDDPENADFERLYVDGDMDFESEYAKIKIKGERMESDEEMSGRLNREETREVTAKARRFREYEQLKKEFGE